MKINIDISIFDKQFNKINETKFFFRQIKLILTFVSRQIIISRVYLHFIIFHAFPMPCNHNKILFSVVTGQRVNAKKSERVFSARPIFDAFANGVWKRLRRCHA